MSLSANIYNTLFRRTSTFTLTVIIGAYFFEAGLNGVANCLFNSINRGKLWDHIKHNYVKQEE